MLRHDPKLSVVATSRGSPDETKRSILGDNGETFGERLHTLQLDVTREDTIRWARGFVEDRFGKGSIKCLFNVAGIVFPRSLLL